jgi:hypothetical protein
MFVIVDILRFMNNIVNVNMGVNVLFLYKGRLFHNFLTNCFKIGFIGIIKNI